MPSIKAKTLKGLTLLITAGPTREYLDPVRFLSNPSSGKMGYALAQACQAAGAKVCLISGPTCLPTPKNVERVDVVSATQMLAQVQKRFSACQVFIASAAVSDFRPKTQARLKIKKTGRAETLTLVPNPDILANMARRKGGRLLVGFAAETDHLAKHAQEKLIRKKLDLLVANNITQPGAGFAADTNIATLFFPQQKPLPLPKMSKQQLAQRIVHEIAKLIATQKQASA